MITRERFEEIMADTFSNYGRDMYTKAGQRMIGAWYKNFRSRDASRFSAAMNKHVLNSERMPRVNEIIGLMRGGDTEGNGHGCPECGEVAEHLYQLGPDFPKCVCIDCHSEAHAYRRLLEVTQ